MNSIYEIINDSIEDGELPESFSLPDIDDGKLKWADGALDGVTVYHMGLSEVDEDTLEMMVQAIKAVADHDYDMAVELFSKLGEQKRAIELIDEIQKYILGHRDELPPENVFKTSVNIILQSDNRENVKFGLSVLEIFNLNGKEDLISKIMTLGLSDEFTLFALFILQRLEDGNDRIFELAKKVYGWGRVHAVDRLEPLTPEIKDWLIEEGVHNTIMPAYSALTCWDKAQVATRLEGDLSENEFRGIRDIIEGLLGEGPVAGCSTIQDWDKYIELFLEKAKLQTLCQRDLDVIKNIKSYFEGDKKYNKEIVDKCHEIIELGATK